MPIDMPFLEPVSARTRYNLLVVAFVLVGMAVGAAAGIGVALAIGWKAVKANPQDHSAGSVAIVVILTFPVGAFIGFFAGALAAKAFLKEPPSPPGFDVTVKDAESQ